MSRINKLSGNAEFFRLARRDVFSRRGLASSGLPPEGKSKQRSQTEINQRFPKIVSEDQILAIIDRHFPRHDWGSAGLPAQSSHASTGLLLGRGDDCAEFVSASALALSTDLFLENYHFRRSYFTPEEIGHKALAVNLSDLAAAGAAPLGFSLGLMCPPDLDPAWLDRMFYGMGRLAAASGIILTGGDISAAPLLGFSLTVWGGAAQTILPANPADTPFLRRGAKAGDMLFVLSAASEPGFSGLGLARLGLKELEAKGRAALADYPQACAALLTPRPQLAAGRLLAGLSEYAGRAGHTQPHCMDVSDGLARDLPRLLAAGKNNNAANGSRSVDQAGNDVITVPDNESRPLGADLDLDYKDLHPELRRRYTEKEALAEAFSGGDDYSLLCACPPKLFPAAEAALETLRPDVHLQVLGRVSAQPGIRWQGTPIDAILGAEAFDHFVTTLPGAIKKIHGESGG